MAQVAIADGLRPETSTKELISDLEERYIKLLQSKIANLESQLAASKGAKTSQNHEGDTSKEEDSDALSESEEHVKLQDADALLAKENGEDSCEKEEPRYAIFISGWDPEKAEYVDVPTDIKEEKKDFGPQPKPRRAFTFRKLTNTRGRLYRDNTQSVGSEVEIEFEPLQRLVGKITGKWGMPEVVTKFRSPYSALIHSWSEAIEEAQRVVDEEPEEEKQARTDLKELLKIISTSSGHVQLDRYFKERDTFMKEHSITHEALWTLFPPGTLILAQPFLDELQIFSVESCDGFVSSREPFDLVCYSFDWNGYEFNRVAFEMSIEGWGEDRKSIVELPFYPLQYYKEPGEESGEESIKRLRSRLTKRGEDYVKFCTAERGKQMFNYDGSAYFQKSGGILHSRRSRADGELDSQVDDDSSLSGSAHLSVLSNSGSTGKKQIKGATIVDFASYFEYQSPKTPLLGPMRRFEGVQEGLSPERRANKEVKDMYKFDWDKHPPHKRMSPLQYLLCPPRVLGYALKPKKWVQLLVKNLSKPDAVDVINFKDKLQLDDDSKELIRKSVETHKRGKEKDPRGRFKGLEDFAPEKGKGLIIMLYGLPGVGKTLTAESVAMMVGKPLLSVGVSDIGIEGDKVEINLQKVFDLAGIWEAVLLFDEADVFLEARGEGENDLRRNAMVSVLLRVLEYYDGILILTTNRMRSFDIAVQSRIHLAIKYDELTSEQKKSIFMSFLEQLHEKKLVDDFNSVQDWVQKDGKTFKFNGRQIRNVVSTALGIGLAETRGKLTREHLSRVARQTDDFKRDLSSQEAIFRDRQITSRYG